MTLSLSRPAASILGALLLAPAAVPPRAHAEPSTELTGFADFSDAAMQLGFDDLGLASGAPIAAVGDVQFSLSSGGVPVYYDDFFLRESEIEGFGSLSNFFGIPSPFPELIVTFAGPVHRVGFEARINVLDEVVVTLMDGGAMVDQMTMPSRGSDMHYFYGLENMAGFDEVRIDALGGASGALPLDNLTFEMLDVPDDPGDPGEDPPGEDPGEEPPMEDPVPVVSCDGFDSFPRVHRGHHPRARALLARLRDADGTALGSGDLAAPQLRVWFTSDEGGDAVDVTERVVWRGEPALGFFGGRLQRWFVILLSKRMDDYGTYMAMLESGDPSAYTVDPTCADWTVVERPKKKQRPWWERWLDDHHEKDRHRRHGRHGRDRD